MGIEKDLEIINNYPDLFGEPPFNPRDSLIAFGLEIGDGWHALLIRTLDKIREELKKNPIEYFRIIQVKEKFAGLRIYADYANNVIDDIIDKAEIESMHICDVCGESGKVRNNGWLTVRCEKHIKGRTKDDE